MGEYDIVRDAYARERFGKPELGEKEFYENLKGEFEFVQKKRTAGGRPLQPGRQARL